MTAFKSQVTHTRIKFQPLDTTCKLVCLTPDSPAVQSVDATKEGAPYMPDRQMTPTVILPEVKAYDPDDVFANGIANKYLSVDASDMQWFVDGKLLGGDSDWREWNGTTGDYFVITDNSENRGAIKIYKNLSVGQSATLTFRGKLLDWRTGLSYEFESDSVTLTVTEKGEDVWGSSIDKPSIIYDPIFDPLLLWDYRNARGISNGGATRDSQRTGKAFEQDVTVYLHKGVKTYDTLPEGVMMTLHDLADKSKKYVVGTDIEVMAMAYPKITLDMRMIANRQFVVKFTKDEKEITQVMFSASTQLTMPTSGKPKSGVDIPLSRKEYKDGLYLATVHGTVAYPELYYLIQWYTKTYDYTAKAWQQGETLQCRIEDIGMGKQKDNAYFDKWFSVDGHVAQQTLTDANGNYLTDENGNILIG